MSFTNITDEELEGKGVTGLPDTPGLSTTEMQQKFDEYSVFLKDKLKTLITELEAEAGALNIGATVPENITADGNIQSILNGLRQYVDDTVVALGTGDMATGVYDPNRDGVIAPAQGGTGQTSMQAARNAMGLGNTLNALPIANGGTGASTVADARNNLGLGNTSGALPVTCGGTGKNGVTAGRVLVGNGANTMEERAIDSTSGGTQGSDSLITSGAVNSKVREMQTSFQVGVDTIYNAESSKGLNPTASTPTALARAVGDCLDDLVDYCTALMPSDNTEGSGVGNADAFNSTVTDVKNAIDDLTEITLTDEVRIESPTYYTPSDPTHPHSSTYVRFSPLRVTRIEIDSGGSDTDGYRNTYVRFRSKYAQLKQIKVYNGDIIDIASNIPENTTQIEIYGNTMTNTYVTIDVKITQKIKPYSTSL